MNRMVIASVLLFSSFFIFSMERPAPAIPETKLIKYLKKHDYISILNLVKKGYEFTLGELNELTKDINFWTRHGWYFITHARIASEEGVVPSLKELATQAVLNKAKGKKLKELPDDLADLVVLNRPEIKLSEIADRLNYYMQKNPQLLLAFWRQALHVLPIYQSTKLLEDFMSKFDSVKPLKNETSAQAQERIHRIGVMIDDLVEEQCRLRDTIIDLLKKNNTLNPLITRAQAQVAQISRGGSGLAEIQASLETASFPHFVAAANQRDLCKKLCFEELMKKLGKKAKELIKASAQAKPAHPNKP